MSGINAYSNSQLISRAYDSVRVGSDKAGISETKGKGRSGAVKDSGASKIETKAWSPIDTASSLVPRKTEYGSTIGDVQLSDKAKDYYDQLKSKYHNMEFIAVSKDMKDLVKQNAAAYGNANKMVVLIDEEKLERMANDESFRKKYEGIIAMSQSKMAAAKNSLASSGVAIKNFGMSVDEDGNESFFATVEKSQNLQKKRIEKKAKEKKELKVKEKKKAEKEAREERIRKSREEKKAEEARLSEKKAEDSGSEDVEEIDDREYVTIEARSLDELFSKVRDYSYSSASARVLTEAERTIGTQVDFRG